MIKILSEQCLENGWDNELGDLLNIIEQFQVLLSDQGMQLEQLQQTRQLANQALNDWELSVIERIKNLPPTQEEVEAHNPTMGDSDE